MTSSTDKSTMLMPSDCPACHAVDGLFHREPTGWFHCSNCGCIWSERRRRAQPPTGGEAVEAVRLDNMVEGTHPKYGRGLFTTYNNTETLYTAPPPPAQPQGWRPIETAPKDGTWILTVNRLYRSIPVVLYWDGHRWWDDSSETPGAYSEYQPTHWQSISEPPQ